MRLIKYIFLLVSLFSFVSCGNKTVIISEEINESPDIFPDYKDITIPYNIAPMNFSYLGEEECVVLISENGAETCVKGNKGLFSFSKTLWKGLTERNKGKSVTMRVAIKKDGKWIAYKPFEVKIANEKIDPYLSYRLIPPGYEGWKKMGIYQRCLEDYTQTAIYENKLTNYNCVNCHSYCLNSPDTMMFHSRLEFDGTVLIQNGNIKKLNTKTEGSVSPFVYPAWHPSGDYIAFSLNKTKQNFHSQNPNRIEVYDLESDIVVYDIKKNQVLSTPLIKSKHSFETFPAFSPDGKKLYFCTAQAVDSLPFNYKDVKYSLCSIDFNPEESSFGNKVDTLFDSAKNEKSVSFPKVSPDGRFLAITVHGYGNFSIWHKDADIYIIDIKRGEISPLSEINSDDAESYHSWSSNSKWMTFSSRVNGLYTMPFFTYINDEGKATKPFLLPQKDPLRYYNNLMVSYNIPELTKDAVLINKHKLSTLLRGKGVNVKSY
jgi:hypothetical protein